MYSWPDHDAVNVTVWFTVRRQTRPRNLKEEHRPDKIRERISARGGESTVADAVLGGVDGIIATFAVVAGSVGGQFSTASSRSSLEIAMCASIRCSKRDSIYEELR
jgi:hypothetical protein